PPAAHGRGSDLRGDAQHGLRLPLRAGAGKCGRLWIALGPGQCPGPCRALSLCPTAPRISFVNSEASPQRVGLPRVETTVERRDHHVCTVVSALHRCFAWLLGPPPWSRASGGVSAQGARPIPAVRGRQPHPTASSNRPSGSI